MSGNERGRRGDGWSTPKYFINKIYWGQIPFPGFANSPPGEVIAERDDRRLVSPQSEQIFPNKMMRTDRPADEEFFWTINLANLSERKNISFDKGVCRVVLERNCFQTQQTSTISLFLWQNSDIQIKCSLSTKTWNIDKKMSQTRADSTF